MIKIEGKNIFLKSLDECNATAEYCSWLCDPEVNKYLQTREATIDSIKQYIKEKNSKEDCLFLGIFFKENQKHIGNVKLEPIDFMGKKATFGLLIGDKNYWGKGLGTEVTDLVARYSFEELGLNEIDLGVVAENKSAIRVYEKVGFKIDKTENGKVTMIMKKQ